MARLKQQAVRSWPGALALCAASLALVTAAVEVGARIVVRRRQTRPPARSFLEYDPELGWRKAAGEEVTLNGEGHPVVFQTNAHGLRGPDRPYPKAPGVVRVLLLGDSFVEGGTVDEESSLRAVLEHTLQADGCPTDEVLNGGTSGYSTDQEYLFFEKEGVRYLPDVVVLLFFSNDLQGNTSTKKKPWFELEGGRLVLRNSPVPPPADGHRRRPPDPAPRLTPWHGSEALRLLGLRTERRNPRLHDWLARLSLVEPAADHPPTRDWLSAYGPDSDLAERRWEITLALIDALRASVSAHGAAFVVFYVPAAFEVDPLDWQRTRERWRLDGDGWDADQVARTLGAACRARAIPFVDPRPALRDAEAAGRRAYFVGDPHWTEVGHRVAAAALAPCVRLAPPCPRHAQGPPAREARR